VRRLLVLTLVLLGARDLGAAVEVRVTGERVDVVATNAPLAEILEGLSRQTHIKLVYEGTPPRQLLTVDIKNRTPAEAVLAVLEGQGLTYAVALDRSGTRVQTLLMSGSIPATAASSMPAAPSMPDRRPPPRESAVEEPLDDGTSEPDPEPQLPPDTGRPMAPQVKPSEPAAGVFLPVPGAADYPTSTFAPKPPAPAPAKPKTEATPPPFNP
jgi:hypothetical protein